MGCVKSTDKKVQNPQKVVQKNQAKKKVNPQIIEEETKDNYIFSTAKKYKKSQVTKNNKQFNPSQISDLQQYCLVEPELDVQQNLEKNYKISFKITEYDDKFNIFCGIAHQDTIQQTQYFKKRWFDDIDHGLYAIDDFGNCFSNIDEDVNNQKLVGWGFSRSKDCIIQIEVVPKTKKLIFRKQYELKDYKPFELSFSTKEIIEEGNFNFFICTGGHSQIEIIDL